MPMQFIVF